MVDSGTGNAQSNSSRHKQPVRLCNGSQWSTDNVQNTADGDARFSAISEIYEIQGLQSNAPFKEQPQINICAFKLSGE